MKLITMIEEQLAAREGYPDLYTYTHESESVKDILHHISATIGPFVNVEQLLLAGMALIVEAIRRTGELPDDLNDLPMPGTAQAAHDARAQTLIGSVPDLCPDCGSAAHPGTCDEPDILSPDG